jgi:putative ABC transport system substrate-binding protein
LRQIFATDRGNISWDEAMRSAKLLRQHHWTMPMKICRRRFLAAVGTVTVAWPYALRAQSTGLPLVGFVNNGSVGGFGSLLEAFRNGLSDSGFVDGNSVRIEARWADGHDDRLPGLIGDLAQRRASVIATTTLSAQAVSKSTPIVFVMGADPVKFGIVKSLNKPDTNITGVSLLSNGLLEKQIAILHETIAKESPIGFLVRASNPNAQGDIRDLTAASDRLGHKLLIAKVNEAEEIAPAIADLSQRGAAAIAIFPDALFINNLQPMVAALQEHRLPAIYNFPDFTRAGGLLCYGANQKDAYRQAGFYAGRVLKGERPSDLPVIQSARLSLIVNLKTAKAFEISLSPTLLATADEVVE